MEGTFSTVPLNVNEISPAANSDLDVLVRNYHEDTTFAYPAIGIVLLIIVIIAFWASLRQT